jgi:hypothetical protein
MCRDLVDYTLHPTIFGDHLCKAVSRPKGVVKPYLDHHNGREFWYVTCSVCGEMVGRERELFQAFTKNHGEPAWLDQPDDLLGCHEAFPGGKAQI